MPDHTDSPVHEGGCFCGRVRYAIEDHTVRAVNCHCSMCRRIHASPFVTWLVVPNRHFRYTAEMPQSLRSSEDGTRYFCPGCGTHVACVNVSHPDITDVSLGSLDQPEAIQPARDCFADTRLAWVGRLRD